MELKGTNMRTIEWAHPRHQTSPLTPYRGVENFPFQISANRLEVDENINEAQHLVAK